MEMMNMEAVATDQLGLDATMKSIDELADLQLVLVGGGIGDTQL